MDKVIEEYQAAKTRNEAVKVKQNPIFILELDENANSADEVEFSDDEFQEGSTD